MRVGALGLAIVYCAKARVNLIATLNGGFPPVYILSTFLPQTVAIRFPRATRAHAARAQRPRQQLLDGPTTSSWSLQQSQSWTRTCLSQRGAGPCFGIGQLFIAPGSVFIAGWKDLGDLAQVAD